MRREREHPRELLAEYVEGSLDPERTARVESHLSSCDVCRDEVALAGSAREALAALPEVEPPAGLDLAVRRGARAPSRRAWMVAGAAAAAGIILGAIVILGPRGGGGATGLKGGSGGGEAAPPGPQPSAPEVASGNEEKAALARAGAVTIQQSDIDYTPASLDELARNLRDDVRASLESGFANTARLYFQRTDLDSFPPQVVRVVDCALREFPPQELLVPYLIQDARFQGQPAYVAVFLQGPSESEPYDRILIWVVDRESCSLRGYATQRL